MTLPRDTKAWPFEEMTGILKTLEVSLSDKKSADSFEKLVDQAESNGLTLIKKTITFNQTFNERYSGIKWTFKRPDGSTVSGRSYLPKEENEIETA